MHLFDFPSFVAEVQIQDSIVLSITKQDNKLYDICRSKSIGAAAKGRASGVNSGVTSAITRMRDTIEAASTLSTQNAELKKCRTRN